MFGLNEQEMKYEPIPYDKEAVEHLIDQLIKLQQAYDCINQLNDRGGLNKAMDTINDSLKMMLKPHAIIKFDQML